MRPVGVFMVNMLLDVYKAKYSLLSANCPIVTPLTDKP
jgi:hypothetical protein